MCILHQDLESAQSGEPAGSSELPTGAEMILAYLSARPQAEPAGNQGR
ncbi:hypothetical protein SAMN05216276_1001231 [Streptosporangium subroseum]|uniref:Uncharacterized protein n=1 Tax=Streptosporangium subroseum TaxID=106412 RepID=A0A239A9S4_9ACTN|nr:hypothetical protein SAMN05216276_1001231 [Streptosporangium subroseum]